MDFTKQPKVGSTANASGAAEKATDEPGFSQDYMGGSYPPEQDPRTKICPMNKK